jgi:hypothetical protein
MNIITELATIYKFIMFTLNLAKFEIFYLFISIFFLRYTIQQYFY